MSTDTMEDGLGGHVNAPALTEQQVADTPPQDMWGDPIAAAYAQEKGWKTPAESTKAARDFERLYGRSQTELAELRTRAQELEQAQQQAAQQQQQYYGGQQQQGQSILDAFGGDIDQALAWVAQETQRATQESLRAEMDTRFQQFEQERFAPLAQQYVNDYIQGQAQQLAGQYPDHRDLVQEAVEMVMGNPALRGMDDGLQFAFHRLVGQRVVEGQTSVERQSMGQVLDLGVRGQLNGTGAVDVDEQTAALLEVRQLRGGLADGLF